jgi:hypothetical protein
MTSTPFNIELVVQFLTAGNFTLSGLAAALIGERSRRQSQTCP